MENFCKFQGIYKGILWNFDGNFREKLEEFYGNFRVILGKISVNFGEYLGKISGKYNVKKYVNLQQSIEFGEWENEYTV